MIGKRARGRAAGPSSARDAFSAPPTAPASVRESLVPARPGQSTPPPSVREVAGAIEIPMPTREVTVEGQVWTVHQKGSARIGCGRGSSARILSVGVEAPEDPENPGATRYVVARSLDDVAEDDLMSLIGEVARAPGADPDSSQSGKPGARKRGGHSGNYRRYRRR